MRQSWRAARHDTKLNRTHQEAIQKARACEETFQRWDHSIGNVDWEILKRI